VSLTLKIPVLGLLIERPSHGYEIGQRLKERLSVLGYAGNGVYEALSQLENDGFVVKTGELGGGERGAPRAVYGPTDAGVDHFEGWMCTSSSLVAPRMDFYAKLALARPHNLPRLIEVTYELEGACLARLGDLSRPAHTAGVPSAQLPWETLAALIVEDAEVARLQSMMAWLQRARALMQRQLEQHRRAAQLQ